MYVRPYRNSWIIFTLDLVVSSTEKIVGIPMGINCDPLVADLFLFAMKEISWFLFLMIIKPVLLRHLTLRLDI